MNRTGGTVESVFFLCRCLSVDDSPVAVAALREEIDAGQVDWRQIARLAADHLLTPALWVSVSRKGLTAHLPDGLQFIFRKIHSLNVERNRRIKSQLLEMASGLNAVGVEPILLKGAVNLFDSAYGDFGARAMWDVDVLIQEAQTAQILAALAELGYRPIKGEGRWYMHTYTCLHRPGRTCTLDLHRYFGYQRSIVAPAEVRHEAVALEAHGLRLLAPSPTHRVFHNIFHAQIQNQNHALGLLPLMQLCDFAALCRHHAGAVDWEYLRATAQRHGLGGALRAYVHSAVELFGVQRPPEILESLAARLHCRRCLAQLRYPAALSVIQKWGNMTGVFGSLKIDVRYHCGTNPVIINIFRLRLLFDAIHKHGWQVIKKARDRLADAGRYR